MPTCSSISAIPRSITQDRVIFLPYEVDFDVAVLENALPLLKGKTAGLVTTVQHIHLIPAMEAFLKEQGHRCPGCRRERAGTLPGAGARLLFYRGTGYRRLTEILFVGTGLFHPIGIALSTGARVMALDPLTGIAQEVSGDALLRRRFAVIEKARGAKSIGIIVSTKSGQHRMALAQRLAALSPHAVIVTMQEVSPDELLNLGFGCYVNTACPRLAYDDQVRFPVPVLSPQEFEILCGVRTGTTMPSTRSHETKTTRDDPPEPRRVHPAPGIARTVPDPGTACRPAALPCPDERRY